MSLRKEIRQLCGLLAGGFLAGCTSGQAGVSPPFTSVNVAATSTLQFAVGTANVAFVDATCTAIDQALGLNSVVTFRNKKTGQDATLLNTPTIAGPAGFTVPSSAGVVDAGNDAGTSHISASPQVLPGQTPTPTTLGTSGGAFQYGFEPDNSATNGGFISSFYSLPFYPDTAAPPCANNGAPATPAQVQYVGGPPVYPRVTDGTFPPGFVGFVQGFTDFLATPITGTYTLSVLVPSASASQNQTLTTTANLTSVTPLGPFGGPPTFTEDGAGGGTISVTNPASLSEAAAYVNDLTAGSFFTVKIPAGAGAQSALLPDNLGKSVGSGTPNPTMAPGDGYTVVVVGYDYPALEGAPPISVSAAPAITGSKGQADITVSVPVENPPNGAVSGVTTGYGSGFGTVPLGHHRTNVPRIHSTRRK